MDNQFTLHTLLHPHYAIFRMHFLLLEKNKTLYTPIPCLAVQFYRKLQSNKYIPVFLKFLHKNNATQSG